jgi:ribosome recycling factor
MIDDVMKDMKQNMEKAIESFRYDLSKIRTGRASLVLLDGIKVDYYGTTAPLSQVATLSVPDARLIVIQPWEAKMIVEIERAIQKSDLGLTPMNDGKIIRLNLPPLTEERRRELARMIKKMTEDIRVSVRNARRESLEFIKELEKDHEITEDDLHKAQKMIQEVTDEHIGKVDQIMEKKEKEVMEV